MKDNLMLKKYKTESVNGTYNLLEEKTFFGTKVMDIEDNISILDESIQYFQQFIENPLTTAEITKAKNNGYQYYELNEFEESLYLMDIVSVKNDNHTIKKSLQTSVDELNNTRWEIEIDIKQILIEYLFGQIKNARTFKSLNYNNFSNNNINDSIYEYITNNLLDRYEFTTIDLYIKYVDIKTNNVYNLTINKQFDPNFSHAIGLDEYKISNVNMSVDLYLDRLAPLYVNYYQTKSSKDYKFDYYFDINYQKI